MRPLVEATVSDGTGTVRATFFNQPWLVERYPPGTRLLLHGALRTGAAASTITSHAQAGESDDLVAEGSVAHYPASEGITSTQILTSSASDARCSRDVPEPLPAAMRAAEGLPDRLRRCSRRCTSRADEDEREAGRRRLAFEELLLDQLRSRGAGPRAPRVAGRRVRRAGRPDMRAGWARCPLRRPMTSWQRWRDRPRLCDRPRRCTGC